MTNFNPKKCLCKVADCGKCLFLGCTDDNCSVHKLASKWRYRNRQVESLTNKYNNLQNQKNDENIKNKLTSLQEDIKSYKKEVKRLNSVLQIK